MPINVQPLSPDQAVYKIPESNVYNIGGRDWYIGIWETAAGRSLCLVGFDTQGTQKWRFVVYESLHAGEWVGEDKLNMLIDKWIEALNNWVKGILTFEEPEDNDLQKFLDRLAGIKFNGTEFYEGDDV